ncbi:CAAX protease self-immunity [Agreia bicolorata]|uniref:CAAX protease self-immunity n=1 Tax=Agreia bicolorata TaxID=110935 RepID=A0A1T4Y1K3_9MICO|nr:CPBP family intramembrane glutamic endopeptidase [Agreia bicolorata]SKA95650.1 CAAX protease self-immunity [Agreia bicolorata]
MHEHDAPSPWKSFWERGGWWKALLLVLVYYGVYQLGGVLLNLIFGAAKIEAGGALGIFVGVGLPILLGCVLLVVLAWSVGWLKELFGHQAIRGRGWMWVAVAVVLITNVLRFVALDYESAGAALILSWMLTGLFVGFAEEVLTRGFVVQLMRKAGHPEIAVALVSAALFAMLHAGNFFNGQGALTTIVQVGYTFFFGLLMYLAYRVTGRLIVPILLHASTDPSIFLLTTHPAAGSLAPIAGLGNIIVILVGLVLMLVLIINGGKDRAIPRMAAN